MYKGKLIEDLLTAVEQAEDTAAPPAAQDPEAPAETSGRQRRQEISGEK